MIQGKRETLVATIILAIIFWICFRVADAKEIEILGSEPRVQENFGAKPQLNQVNENYLRVLEGQREFSLGLRIGPNLDSYNLDGQGFTTSLPPDAGLFFGVGLNYLPNLSTIGYLLEANRWSSSYAGVPNVDPSDVSISHTLLLGAVEFHPIKSLRNLSVHGGYFYQSRSASKTIPNSVVNAVINHGPVLGAAFDYDLADELLLRTKVRALFPLSYQEQYEKSGFYKSSFILRGGLSVEYAYSESIGLGLGMLVGLQKAYFEGQGPRGVSNAETTFLSISFPFEVRLRF